MRLLKRLQECGSAKSARAATLDAIVIVIISTSLAGSLLITALSILHRTADKRISAELSSRGAEIIQLRRLGLDLLDAQTGRRLDQLEFISPWRNALRRFTPEFQLATESPLRRPDDSPRVGESKRILSTRDAQVILALLYEDGIVWWNRKTRSHRLLTAPRTRFLRIAIDEPRNRFYAECVEAPDDPFSTPPPENAAQDAEPWQFDAVRTIRLYDLSTGESLKSFHRMRVGQCVQNQPDRRVFAQAGAVELAAWPDFPEGSPKTIETYRPHEALYESLLSAPPRSIAFQDESLTIEQINSSDELPQVTTLRKFVFDSSGAESTRSHLTDWTRRVTPLSEIAGRVEVAFTGFNIIGPADIRVHVGQREAVFRDRSDMAWNAHAWSAAKISPTQIRVANENGLVFDFDPASPKESRFWSIPLPPHEKIPTNAAALLALGALSWLAYSLRTSCFLVRQGWLVLLSFLAWPLILCGIERGYTGEPLHEYFAVIAIAFSSLLFFAALVGLFLSQGRSRAGAIAPCALFSLLVATAALNYLSPDSASILRPFRDPRRGDDFLISWVRRSADGRFANGKATCFAASGELRTKGPAYCSQGLRSTPRRPWYAVNTKHQGLKARHRLPSLPPIHQAEG